MSDLLIQDKMTPKWLRDLLRLLPIRAQFILSGNVDDLFLADGEAFPNEMHQTLWNELSKHGYKLLVRYDRVDGISIFPDDADVSLIGGLGIQLSGQVATTGSAQSGGRSKTKYMPVSHGTLLDVLKKIVTHPQRIAMLIEINPASFTEERDFLVACDKLARESKPIFDNATNTRLLNPVIWRVNRRSDLPAWFGMNNNRILSLEVDKPNQGQRMKGAECFLSRFQGYEQASEIERSGYAKTFADLSDSLTLRDMMEIAMLSQAHRFHLSEIDDVVRSYKTGDQTLDNPWRSESIRGRITSAEKLMLSRVKGQNTAVELAMDILKRSVLGLTGAHKGSSHGRPRGVLFLAGPTGVGKTELAKALTEGVFGDEQAYIRFDMSEFSAEHAEQRLVGAPPSYVGYESGGELTNAIRARPFSLVLFDEIEKAHPRILDKFLQILEDGRLTDGQGETVYFSESIIVFTSNLGIVGRDGQGEAVQLVTPDVSYEEVKKVVLKGIKDHFTLRLGRPEILNRLGENIVVFDFIRKDVAKQIFDIMVENIKKRVKDEHDAQLELSPESLNQLLDWSTDDLSNGGRGIGSCLENMLINPLARALFQAGEFKGKNILLANVRRDENHYIVDLKTT